LTNASKAARARLVGAIKTEAAVRDDEIKRLVADVGTLNMTETVWDNRAGQLVDGTNKATQVTTKVVDIDTQYNATVRALPDATGKWYWNALLEDDPDMDPYDAKAKVAALAKTKDMAGAFKAVVEKAAVEQIAAWRSQYANQVQMLSKAARIELEAAWNPQVGVLSVDLEIPETVSAPTEKISGSGEHTTTTPVPTYARHLYVAPEGHAKVEAGRFPAVLTSWEIDVLAKEVNYPSLLVWYRNPPRSKHGLAIPYRDGSAGGGAWGLLYPDFLLIHRVGEQPEAETVVDIVDPHRHNEGDTGPKWAGLARWAAVNHDKVRRVVGVIKVADALLALDLTQDGIADRLETCRGKSDIEALFAEKGSSY
jgi:hypothetical protein